MGEEMRGLRRGTGGGVWHKRTNKYLFRILHSTLLQRVWFPGSTALLMHPSTLYSHPQSTEIRVGREKGGERTSQGGVKKREQSYMERLLIRTQNKISELGTEVAAFYICGYI